MKTTVTDLSRLKQVQLAWLLNRPTTWIRSHSDLFERNPDGTYNGRQAVQIMIQTQQRVVVLDMTNVSDLLAAAEANRAKRPSKSQRKARMK